MVTNPVDVFGWTIRVLGGPKTRADGPVAWLLTGDFWKVSDGPIRSLGKEAKSGLDKATPPVGDYSKDKWASLKKRSMKTKWLTVRDVTQYLKTAASTLCRPAQEGTLPRHKVGGNGGSVLRNSTGGSILGSRLLLRSAGDDFVIVPCIENGFFTGRKPPSPSLIVWPAD